MKLLQKILLSLLLITVLLISGLWAGIHYYGDEIKGFVIKSINKQLRTKVDVQAVDISFWKSFPQTAVVFREAVIYAVNDDKDSLLYAKNIAANFNLLDLYHKDYQLKGLQIEHGFCRMLRYENEKTNYSFWKAQEHNKASSFSVDLQKVQLINMRYEYVDRSNAVNVNFLIDKASLSGNFKKDIFKLQIKSTLKQSNISNADVAYVKDKTLFLSTNATVNSKKSAISFEHAKLGIQAMNFNLKGKINYAENPRIDFRLKSNNTDLSKAIQLLPKSLKKGLADYEIDGKAIINGSLSGPLTAIDQPAYHFNFAIEKGSFIHAQNKLRFEDSFLKGSIHNGKMHKAESSEIVIDQIRTTFNGGKIKGKLSLKNFKQPRYNFQGSMNFKLKDATTLFAWDDLKKVEGTIAASLSLSGSLSKLDRYNLKDWKRSKVKGQIKLNNVGFYYRDGPQHFHSIKGEFELQNNNVKINSLEAFIDDNQVNFEGSFNNLIAYLLEEDEMLIVDAKLSSPAIQLEDFLAANSAEEDSAAFQLRISPQLKVYLHTKIASLSFKKFTLNNLSGNFIVNNQQIDGRNILFKSLDGEVSGDFFIREKAKVLKSYAQFSVKKININKLFYSFDNFGQSTLKSENLSGISTADIEYSCQWSKTLVPDLQSLKVSSDLLIENGVLKNYKPLEKLSSHISLEALREVKFKNLSNQILIRDKAVIIPKFDVNSSALNIGIQGKHYFNNKVDYSFRLLLNEILSKKVKKPQKSEFGYIEDDGLGRTKIFVKMTGNLDNPIFSYDKQALKKHLKSEVNKEKETVKTLLNKEFGLFKNDQSLRETKTEQAAKNQNKAKKQPYRIEWEEAKKEPSESKEVKKRETQKKKKEKKEKGKFGKFMDKLAEPNKDEYE